MGSDFKRGLGPLAPGAHLAPYADCANCPFKLRHPTCGLLCVDFVRDKLSDLLAEAVPYHSEKAQLSNVS